jgi:hypothetical protein
MADQTSHQAGNRPRRFFTTQAGGCAYDACGVRPARKSEVAPPSASLSSQNAMPASGSLRSARCRQRARVSSASTALPKRSERLYVRLTADEAEQVAYLANRRGVKISDYVRKVVLRGSRHRLTSGRRVLPSDSASTVRVLSAIAQDLRHLVVTAETNGTVCREQLEACLAAVYAAIGGFAA